MQDDRVEVIALAGASGSGKSLLASYLRELLGSEQCAVIHLDHFYRDLSHLTEQEREQVNFDCPAAIDGEAARHVLEQLRSGVAVALPEYDFATHTRSRVGGWIEPARYIIVEGLFVLQLPQLRELFSRCWYLDVSPEECFRRRLVRDKAVRGRTEEEITRRYNEYVLPSLEAFVWPQKGMADLALDGEQGIQVLALQCLAELGEQPTEPMRVARIELLPQQLIELGMRMGMDRLGSRLARQSSHFAGLDHQGEGVFKAEKWIPMDRIIRNVLRFTGLGYFAAKEARALKVEENVIALPEAPQALDGFTLLQLSDLHLDMETGVFAALAEVLPTLHYDLVVITGDYRNSTYSDPAGSLDWMRRLMPLLRQPAFGILGNHDFIEMVPELEGMGLRMLINESVSLAHGDARVLLTGIDDPHYYQTHAFGHSADSGRVSGMVRILLSHSPAIYREAAALFDMMLCGHTHGGQLCLPGSIPLVRNGRCPARMIAGAWQEGSMLGYTSRGTGCCGVAGRLFCPPEITLHRFVTK